MSGRKSTEKQQSPSSGGKRTKRRSVKRSSSDESSGNSSGIDSASRHSTRHRRPPVHSYRVINEDSPDLELEIPTGVPLRELGLATSPRWNNAAVRRRDESHPRLDYLDIFADDLASFGSKFNTK